MFSERLKPLLNRLPYIRGLRNRLDQYETMWPPGHYYSPIVDPKALTPSRTEWLKDVPAELPGIDLCEANQLALLPIFSKYAATIPFTPHAAPPYRYYFENGLYSYGDAVTLFGMLRHVKPKRIIELGSGFSSALMLDTADHFMDTPPQMTFVEPYPQDRLNGLLQQNDRSRATILETFAQTVELTQFDALEKDDILFVDSTHVMKTGSDVNHILFNILPRLKTGTLIHFHDIFYPFDYPPEWVFGWKGFGWNEAYALRAFLMYNPCFEIVFFNSFMHRKHADWFAQHLPLAQRNPGGSIWLRKK